MQKEFSLYNDMKHRIERAAREAREEATLSIFYPVKQPRKGLFGPLADRLFGPEIVFVPADDGTRKALQRLEHEGYQIRYKRIGGSFSTIYCRAIAVQLNAVSLRKSA